MKLTKLNKARPKKIAVVDVETYGFGATAENFAFGVLFFSLSNFEVFYDVVELKNRLLELRGYVIFAHNAEYDYTTIFGNIKKYLDRKAIFIGSSFICAKNNGVTFYDSYRLFPTKLKNLGEALGCLKGTYKDIQPKIGEAISLEAINYCVRDCEIVFKAVERSFELIGAIKPTIGSASLFYFRRVFLEKDLYYNDLAYEFGNSYYGGRTEAFYIGSCLGFCYDINSMYPWAMRKIFPNPDKLTKITNATVSQLLTMLRAGYEGMATIKLHSYKENQFPPLPCKLKGKLMFVNGIFSGSYNFPELKHAIDNNLIEILSVSEIIYSKTAIDSPFTEFIDSTYNLRKKTVGFDNLLYKLLMNNLYGKFSEKTHGTKEYFDEMPIEHIKKLTEQKIKFKIHLFSEKREDCEIETFETDEKFAKTAIPMFSSYITSYARVLLHTHMLKNKDNKVLYCDTDSVILRNCNMQSNLSNELGDFKLEDKIFTEIRGCKNYDCAEIDHDGFLNQSRKIKGIPKNAIEIDDFIYKYNTMIKTLGGLRRNLESGVFVETKKAVTNLFDKRKILSDGNTEPFYYIESENKLI